jgi:drug/metabolite transporter (DMT)-like permease
MTLPVLRRRASVDGTGRRLFLRWALRTMLAASLLGVAAAGLVHGIHGAPLALVCVIVGLTVLTTAYLGVLSWRADADARDPALRRGLDHVALAYYSCQILGLVGAMLGVYLVSGAGNGDAAQTVASVTGAMANGLLATMTGVVCSLLLIVEHHALSTELRKADG